MNQKEAKLLHFNVSAVERVNRLLKRVARDLANERKILSDVEVINICTENSLNSCTPASANFP